MFLEGEAEVAVNYLAVHLLPPEFDVPVGLDLARLDDHLVGVVSLQEVL